MNDQRAEQVQKEFRVAKAATSRSHAFVVIVLATSMSAAEPEPAAPTVLSISRGANNQVTAQWPASATGLVLETASELGSNSNWQPIGSTPVREAGGFAVQFPVSQPQQFFRLRASLATIERTSPANGEAGVAVIRETIVRLTRPLAADAMVNANSFFAGFGGRRLLTRTELSPDRRTLSLFYLEPLPGSTRVTVSLNGAGLTDNLGLPLDPDGDGQPGGTGYVQFNTLSVTPVAGTAVIGQVFAAALIADANGQQRNHPLAGVTITVEETLRTVTDAEGRFTLEPVPAGRFFVKIDGRTAKESNYPGGPYYPYVGKAWDAVAGVATNRAGGTGEIFLPLITADTLQPTSATTDTTISLPAPAIETNSVLAGVSITVPANALFSTSGSRGGKVGLATVPPDRLPGPLPPGLELPVVITVQTDGPDNFDRPAPVCFPNLPDPATEQISPPGSKRTLISFNHKKGVWEGVGSMTISADGKLACSDPGVGIVQPGWHGVAPPSVSSVGPGDCGYIPPPLPCFSGSDKQTCQRLAKRDDQECHDKRREWARRFMNECDKIKKQHGDTDPWVSQCYNQFNELNGNRANMCDQWNRRAQERCDRCYSGGSFAAHSDSSLDSGGRRTPAGLHAPSPILSVKDQIAALYDEVAARIQPFAVAHQPVPEAILAEIEALYATADVLAGGDAQAFLQGEIIQAERERAASPSASPQDPGNAPEYPILYVAHVSRASGPLEIRGETGPYGQFEFFLPADGVLLSMDFYDPKTKRQGLSSRTLVRRWLSNFRDTTSCRCRLKPQISTKTDWRILRNGWPVQVWIIPTPTAMACQMARKSSVGAIRLMAFQRGTASSLRRRLPAMRLMLRC